MIRNYTWYNKILDLNKPESIHQVLAYGTIEEIKELKNKIGSEKLKTIFLNYPAKVYYGETLNFIKNFILEMKEPIDEKKYLKDSLRDTRP